MQPYVYGPKFMWNLTNSVGKGGAHTKLADVSFIQWYYTLALNFPPRRSLQGLDLP